MPGSGVAREPHAHALPRPVLAAAARWRPRRGRRLRLGSVGSARAARARRAAPSRSRPPRPGGGAVRPARRRRPSSGARTAGRPARAQAHARRPSGTAGADPAGFTAATCTIANDRAPAVAHVSMTSGRRALALTARGAPPAPHLRADARPVWATVNRCDPPGQPGRGRRPRRRPAAAGGGAPVGARAPAVLRRRRPRLARAALGRRRRLEAPRRRHAPGPGRHDLHLPAARPPAGGSCCAGVVDVEWRDGAASSTAPPADDRRARRPADPAPRVSRPSCEIKR